MCQDCHDLIFKGSENSRIHICRNCGKVICNKCSYTRLYLYLFKRRWCRECEKRILSGKITEKKNKEVIKKVKKWFKTWKSKRSQVPVIIFK